MRAAARAAVSVASACDLRADDAVVLQDSDKLTLHLSPCDVVARVAHVGRKVAEFEVELAQRLAATGSPAVALDPRVEPCVYVRDGFTVTLWTYHEPVPTREATPTEYADALKRLHAGMRQIDVLRAGGSNVETIFPDGSSKHLFGANAMDLSLRPAAAQAGYDQGRALAEQFAEF